MSGAATPLGGWGLQLSPIHCPPPYHDWAATMGPMEETILQEITTALSRCRLHSDPYVVLTNRQADTISEMLRWMGAPDHGGALRDTGQRVSTGDDPISNRFQAEDEAEEAYDEGFADGLSEAERRMERAAARVAAEDSNEGEDDGKIQ